MLLLMLWAQVSAIVWLTAVPSIASTISQQGKAAAQPPKHPPNALIKDQSTPPPLSSSSAATKPITPLLPRSPIITDLCDPYQHFIITTSLIRAIAWSEVASIKVRRDTSSARDEQILAEVFNHPDIPDRERGWIEQRYRALIGEVERWNEGVVQITCATERWRPCWRVPESGTGRVRLIMIDVHVAEGLLVMVSPGGRIRFFPLYRATETRGCVGRLMKQSELIKAWCGTATVSPLLRRKHRLSSLGSDRNIDADAHAGE
ncbi:MAG: hypothetical protein Q9160_005278 [Pyrenula sp. 1 TL-2023]